MLLTAPLAAPTFPEEAQAFLNLVQSLLAQGRVIFIASPESLQTLVALGLTRRIVLAHIGELTVDGYCDGPLEVFERPQAKHWTFGQMLFGSELRIEFLLEDLDPGRWRVTILSYRRAEWALQYPFKNRTTMPETLR